LRGLDAAEFGICCRLRVWGHALRGAEGGFILIILSMSVIFILIMASLFLATGFLVCFIWAVRSGQFDDTLTPSLRILTDERGVGGEMSSDSTLTKDAEGSVPAKQPKPNPL
jgi:cbb3-type cytochrome oxidase maturation protein